MAIGLAAATVASARSDVDADDAGLTAGGADSFYAAAAFVPAGSSGLDDMDAGLPLYREMVLGMRYGV